ncbi:ATP-binding protein [Candidatus Omnitrophota bacterium]
MKKLHKITNIAAILILIGVFLGQDATYALDISHLRVPSIFDPSGIKRPENTAKRLIEQKIDKLISEFTQHKLRNKVAPINEYLNHWIDILEEKGAHENWARLLVRLCEECAKKWIFYLKEMETLYSASQIDLDINKLLEGMDEQLKATRSIAVIFKGLLDDGQLESDKYTLEIIDGINDSLDDLLSLKDTFLSLDASNINELINLYVKSIGTRAICLDDKRHNVKVGRYDLRLSNEELSFERVEKKESYVIFGMIDNFITNAVRVAKREINIEIKTSREGKYIKIEISDTGDGILRRILPKIFEEGFTTKEVEEGGQGLYLTLEYLKLKGGKIQVDTKRKRGKAYRLTFDDKLEKSEISESDRTATGTTFIITLPFSQPDQTLENLEPMDQLSGLLAGEIKGEYKLKVKTEEELRELEWTFRTLDRSDSDMLAFTEEVLRNNGLGLRLVEVSPFAERQEIYEISLPEGAADLISDEILGSTNKIRHGDGEQDSLISHDPSPVSKKQVEIFEIENGNCIESLSFEIKLTPDLKQTKLLTFENLKTEGKELLCSLAIRWLAAIPIPDIGNLSGCMMYAAEPGEHVTSSEAMVFRLSGFYDTTIFNKTKDRYELALEEIEAGCSYDVSGQVRQEEGRNSIMDQVLDKTGPSSETKSSL